MLSKQFKEIKKRIEMAGIDVKDALSVIGMTFEDQIKRLESSYPYDVFSELNVLIDRTVDGTKIESFAPRDDCKHFHTLEIHTEEGKILGYLNMLYLKKFITCYYLVYVEIMPSFRGFGLGGRILTAYMDFLNHKKAVGLLDNIIPSEDPTSEIYNRLGWKPLTDFIGRNMPEEFENYMIFIPPCLKSDNLKNNIIRVVFNLKKKRPVIDMHDNEDMVKRTIDEFRLVYQTMVQLFHDELTSGDSNPLMCFMFTILTIKLVGFRRRIASLIGYTGGESIEQIKYLDRIKGLPIQPYSIWRLEQDEEGVWGDGTVLRTLPPELRDEPTLFIEELPFYNRPYLREWMKSRQYDKSDFPLQGLTIGELIDLGFDPTRLREFHYKGEKYVFERIDPHFFLSLMKKRAFLKKLEKFLPEMKFCNTIVRINQLLLIFRDKGNIYVLRKKVEAIHLQEALDQLRTVPYLIELNSRTKIDMAMIDVINDFRDWVKRKFYSGKGEEMIDLTYFIPWDIENNFPKVDVGVYKVAFSFIWIA